MIIIQSIENDAHTEHVCNSLTQKGIEFKIVDFSKLKAENSFSFLYTENINFRTNQCIEINKIKSVWRRRIKKTEIPSYVSPEDSIFVKNQINHFKNGFWSELSNLKWVNSMEAGLRADNKITQLALARKIGLKVPSTLISNNSDLIKEFILAKKNVIYKPLSGHTWKEQGKYYSTYTSLVDIACLPSDRMLTICPGIYQEHIKKKMEVRIVIFGKNIFPASIHSNEESIDWRLNQSKGLKINPIIVPDDISKMCIHMMEKLDISYAAFDFIISKEDLWYFLEVNESGQYLFMENEIITMNITDAFCNFLNSSKIHNV